MRKAFSIIEVLIFLLLLFDKKTRAMEKQGTGRKRNEKIDVRARGRKQGGAVFSCDYGTRTKSFLLLFPGFFY
jgi:hypothetical protein